MSDYVFSERANKNNRTEVLDVHYNGKNVAYLRANPKKKVVYIDSLYVSPEHRRKDLANELLSRAIQKYKDKELRLQADPFRDKPVNVNKLKKFYARHGFQSSGRWQMVRKPKEKTAGGNVIGGLLGAVSRPFLGAQRSQALRDKVVGSITKHVNQPIENALHRSGVHGAISKAYEVGMRPIPGTPKLVHPILPDVAQRRAYGNWRADDITHTMANNPEALGAMALPFLHPAMAAFPATSTYLGTKTIAGRALGGLSKLATVRPYQQETQWTCSAACLKAVLSHYGKEFSEMELVEAIGTREGRGAECDEIAEGARKLGFDAFEYSFDSIDQAKVLLDQQIPLICDIQSFNNPGKGHYVVMVSSSDQSVELMDPNTPGNWRTLSKEEMDERWWDRAMAPPHNLMLKWAIIVLPSE